MGPKVSKGRSESPLVASAEAKPSVKREEVRKVFPLPSTRNLFFCATPLLQGPEGFQRASGKPFGRLRRGEILYVCKGTMHDLQNDKAKYFANKRNGRGSIKAWNRGRFYASYQLFSKKGVPSSRTSTSMSEKCRGTGLVIRYFRISSMRTLSWKVTREKLTPCLWARPVRPMRWR